MTVKRIGASEPVLHPGPCALVFSPLVAIGASHRVDPVQEATSLFFGAGRQALFSFSQESALPRRPQNTSRSPRIPKLETLGIVYPNAAGLDIGSREIWACVPAERDPHSVRPFPTFTPDLERLVAWLKACQIDTVAMESTGVYWIPIFELLEAHGIRAALIEPRQLKRVPGRKSDVVSG